MLGGGQVVVRKQPATGLDVREAAARLVLREAHRQGHAYVELREAGGKKRATVFFCTLCLTQCFSDSALWDHLRGGPHARKLAAAKPTLFGPLPWPFRDGVLFFGGESFPSPRTPLPPPQAPLPLSCIAATSCSDHEASASPQLGEDDEDSNGRPESDANSASQKNEDSRKTRLSLRRRKTNGSFGKRNGSDGILICKDSLTIHDVLIGEKVSHLNIRSIGLGHISARVRRHEQAGDADDGNGVVCRIWCAWLGEGEIGDTEVLSTAQDCEFAVVTFSYTLDLGRRGSTGDFNLFSLEAGEERESGGEEEDTNSGSSRKRQKKSISSYSDSEENSVRITELVGDSSSPEYSSASSALSKSTKDDGGIQRPRRLLSSKAMRRELRRRERLAAERACGICRQKMLPGKDVAALLNLKTGKLSCSSRNTNGAFHVFHISCLIQWILMCEFEMWKNGKVVKTRGGGRGRKGKRATSKRQISSIFCPECQGTGVHVKGDQLEHPTIPLSEMFHYELRSIQARRSWMEDPEPLESCSTGLYLTCEESLEEKTPPSKLLHFFRAN